MSNAKASYGTTITRAGNTIGELDTIGLPGVKVDTIDVTTHQSAAAFKEFIAGLIESGDIPLKGNFYSGDTNGQVALLADAKARALVAFVITAADSSWTFTFNGLVTGWELGEAKADGKYEFSGTVKISGEPTLAILASNNATVLTLTDNVGLATFYPAFAAGTYEYVVVTAAAAVTYKVNVTFAAGVCTVVDGAGGTQTVLTTVDSGSIAIPASSFHDTTITVKETGKVAKVYKLHVQND